LGTRGERSMAGVEGV